MRQISRKRCLTLGCINRRFAVNNAKVREERLEIFKVGFYFFGLQSPQAPRSMRMDGVPRSAALL